MAEQISCPAALRPQRRPRPPINYESAPPGGDRGDLINGMAVGDTAWVMTFRFFEDDRGMLWVEGASCRRSWDEGDCAHIERLAEGVRVLEWPLGRRIASQIQEPNRFLPLGDIWVVEMPADVEGR